MTPCAILFRDDAIVVVDKPAGMLSHPNPGSQQSKARSAFAGKYDFNRKCFAGPDGPIWLLHRLDQDTSGALLAAFDEKSTLKLRESFEDDSIRKTYLALVRGNPGLKGQYEDHLQLRRERDRVRTQVLRGHEPNARLRFKNLGYSEPHRVSLVEIELLTGKTHQIRVQFNSRQHPLAGDDIYGDFAWNRKLGRELRLDRLFLHAWRLSLRHPVSGRILHVDAPLPDNLKSVLDTLELPSTREKLR